MRDQRDLAAALARARAQYEDADRQVARGEITGTTAAHLKRRALIELGAAEDLADVPLADRERVMRASEWKGSDETRADESSEVLTPEVLEKLARANARHEEIEQRLDRGEIHAATAAHLKRRAVGELAKALEGRAREQRAAAYDRGTTRDVLVRTTPNLKLSVPRAREPSPRPCNRTASSNPRRARAPSSSSSSDSDPEPVARPRTLGGAQ